MSDADLLALVTKLDHHDQARQLSARYAAAVDSRDFDALGEVFAPDAVLDIPDLKLAGRTAIVEWFREYMETTMPGWMGRHFIVNHRFDAEDSGGLPMQTYFFYTFRGTVESIVGWGRYDHTVVFSDGVARLSYKRITVDSQSEVSEGWAL
jgi:3-phenylpropionate/cinnamic acid dioxygenase small subunit